MSKSNYRKEIINQFVNNKYQRNITLTPVVEGQESQVYSFTVDNKDYIIRINPNLEGFKKDKYAYDNFASNKLSIPQVFDLGKFDDTHYYCISEKIKGITFEDSSEEVVESLLQNITLTHQEILQIDISKTTGFGVFESYTGNAPFKTWKDFLLDILNKDKYNWEKVKSLDFIDTDLIDKIITTFKELVNYCPEKRELFHGDFGSNNVMVDNSKISGVIDWDCASYGDSLFDIAISYFWSTWLMCMDKTSKYWDELYKTIPEYNKSIKCYQLYIGLTEIYENALEEDVKSSNWLQQRCREILQ